MHRLTEDFSSSSNSPAASRHHFRLLRLCSACSGCCSLTTLHLGVLRLTCSGTPQTIPYNPGPVLLPVNLEGHRGPGKSSLDASSFVRPGDGRGRAVAAAATPRPIGGRGRAAAAATPRLRAPGRRTGKSVDGRGFGVRDSGRICISNLESVGSTYSSKGGGIDSDGESQPRADRRRRQEIVDPWPTSGKRTCCSRMDEYIASLHEASVGILGEGLRDAEGMGSRAMPPPPTVASQQSEAAMSASGGVGNSDVAGPSRGHGKATAPRNKQSNFSVYEDNILCKSWLEISCDPITNTGLD